MKSSESTRIIEYALGVIGVVLTIGWIAIIGFMISQGEVETPLILILLTVAGLIVMRRNAVAT